MVKDGVNGYLVEPRSSKQLADKIIKVLENPKKASYMGQNGYKLVKQNHTWDKIALKTINIYKDLLE
jgi:glycosyltransferase involved in cell wall biosynthesis